MAQAGEASAHSAEVPQLTSALVSPSFTLTMSPTPSLTLAIPKKLAAAEQRNIRPPRFGCPLCPQQFTTKRNLDNHHDSHYARIVHHCDRCNEDFSTKSSLFRHQKKHL
ncbi:hypothetical protein K443DRAFT_107527 [Laccaria amethystina LaAM-08-1]|uniref:C2H2-type domain-containing protein n=1 Tax=Laccaria amethystina LaAM-08-1 TaxID=1095629 RepID=A0A0C9X4P7_9AGAR|nr:hypothetical protein K443DRAFT_107527 [Laccaria amethystina LaAM-08-1]